VSTIAGVELDQATAVFAEVRPRLFGIAYRMLGSVVDAEDLVQEVWLRWQASDRSVVLNPAAYLATATTRLAINAGQTARVRHEAYVGQWLPEPVDTSADPQLGAERDSALEVAVLFLLEKLTPTQRAAYVLREAFDYAYSEIAEIIQATEASVRQLVSRARRQLADERRTPTTGSEQRRLLTAFVAAARDGDMAALEELLAADVVSYSDGGGVARATRIPVRGAVTVAKYVCAFANRFWVGVEVSWTMANGNSAAVLRREGVAFAVVTVGASADGIDHVFWQLNPGKLTSVGR
jgi:RNA polymerase sigma-70 factor (ECF subfamily)